MCAFLEPVYLNEKMVLNCAAYLWKGVALETESTAKTEGTKGGSVSVGIPFLKGMLSPFTVGAEGKKSTVEENRSAKRYTTGGLHMAVLDELRQKKMITMASTENLAATDASYVEIQAVLRPIDYYALIGTLKTLLPVGAGAQIFRDCGDKFFPTQQPNQKHQKPGQNNPGALAERYEKSFMSLLEKLEADYLTSRQLEMVMSAYGGAGTPIGVVDLDTSDSDAAEIRAKLTGGCFHVIGKVVNRIGPNESLNLMQRSVLSAGLDLANKLVSLNQEQSAIQNYVGAIEKLRPLVAKLLGPALPGPLLRVLAMSVCV